LDNNSAQLGSVSGNSSGVFNTGRVYMDIGRKGGVWSEPISRSSGNTAKRGTERLTGGTEKTPF